MFEAIQPQARTEEQKLKEKILASGLQPANFKMGLKKMRAEADIFREENLELLVDEQKLNAEYNKIIGSQTMLWNGEERTASQMYPLLQEQDRAVREKAWQIMTEAHLKNQAAAINGSLEKIHGGAFKDCRQYRYAQLSKLCLGAKIPF